MSTHSTSPILFVGYETLEGWNRSTQPKQPVYAMLIHEPGPDDAHGLHFDTLVILVAQPDQEPALVHYCRIPLGRVAYLYNQPFDSDYQQRLERAEHAFALVRAWLEEQERAIVPGLIAMPTGYRYLDGWPDFLVFDPTRQDFIRTDRPGEDQSAAGK